MLTRTFLQCKDSLQGILHHSLLNPRKFSLLRPPYFVLRLIKICFLGAKRLRKKYDKSEKIFLCYYTSVRICVHIYSH